MAKVHQLRWSLADWNLLSNSKSWYHGSNSYLESMNNIWSLPLAAVFCIRGQTRGGRHSTEVAFALLTQPSWVRFLCQLVKIEPNLYPRTCRSKLFGVRVLRKDYLKNQWANAKQVPQRVQSKGNETKRIRSGSETLCLNTQRQLSLISQQILLVLYKFTNLIIGLVPVKYIKPLRHET